MALGIGKLKLGLSGGNTGNPSRLFANGEVGAWYDPSDLLRYMDEGTPWPTATLFQDSAGTTPVTALEQPVGLILDHSQGLVLGPELVTNGDNESAVFDFGALASSDVTHSRQASPSGSGSASKVVSIVAINSSHQIYNTGSQLVAGAAYKITGRVYVPTGGVGAFKIFDVDDGSWFGTTIATKDQWVPFSVIRTAKASFWHLAFGNNALDTLAIGATAFWLDDVSIREIPGHPAYQSTSTSRGTVSARVNLLTETENFAAAAWTKAGSSITDSAIIAPNGSATASKLTESALTESHQINQSVTTIAGSYTFSVYAKQAGQTACVLYNSTINYGRVFNLATGELGAAAGTEPTASSITDAGNGWYRCSITVPATASTTLWRIYVKQLSNYAGGGTSGIYIWGADLRLTADTDPAIPAYQRVGAATAATSSAAGVPDYDWVGFPVRIRHDFDAVADNWYQTAAIDFSGTDAVSIWAGVQKRSDAAAAMLVELTADLSANNGAFAIQTPHAASASIIMQSKGTVATYAEDATVAAPNTSVVYGEGDISADRTTLYVDGALSETVTGNQGTGNYSNAAMYIGGRGGASRFLTGAWTQLIVRGAPSTAAERDSIARYVARKTGKTL